MDRVIGLLGQEVSRASSRMSDGSGRASRARMPTVRQAARLVPDEATFRARAEM